MQIAEVLCTSHDIFINRTLTERQVWELIGTGVRFDGRGTVLTAVGSAVYTSTLCFQQEANRIRTIA